MLSTSQKYGLSGELEAYKELEKLGYNPILVSNFFEEYDILISGCCRVEVKQAKLTYRWTGKLWAKRYQFNVSGLPKDRDCLVILIVDTGSKKYRYVCPSWELWQRSNISITSHPDQYKGRLAKYLENWEIVPTVINQCMKYTVQLTLF